MPTVPKNRKEQLRADFTVFNPNGSTTSGLTQPSFTVNGFAAGTNNPLYKDQIVKHLDATTPYVREECLEATAARHSHSMVYYQKSPPAVYHSVQRSNWLTVRSAAVDDLVLKDRALLILKRKMASAVGSMPSMAPLAELRELRGLIRGLADTVTGKTIVRYAAARAAADRRYPLTGGRHKAELDSALAQRRKFLGAAWLQINFGLLPTMRDVADASAAIAARLEGFPPTQRLVAVASKDWITGGKYTVNSDQFLSRTIHSVNVSHTLSYMYVAGVAPRVLAGNNYSVASQFGFAWRELPGVLWELTPYSWLFDYFANVGEYLGDTFVCPPGYSTYLTCTKRYTCESQENPGSELFYPTVGSIVGDSSSPGRYRYLALSREKLTSLPHIGLHLKTDDRIGSNAVNKLLNLLSVYIQRK